MPFFISSQRIDDYENKIADLSARLAMLEEFYEQHGGVEVFKSEQILALNSLHKSVLKREIRKLEEELKPLVDEEFLTDYSLYDLTNLAEEILNLQIDIQDRSEDIKQAVKDGEAESHLDDRIIGFEPRNKTVLDKLIKNLVKSAMQTFNTQAKALLDKVTPANYSASIDRLVKQARAVEKSYDCIGLEISSSYFRMWSEQMRLSAEIQKARNLQKELEREHKAELREAARVERELEAERLKLEKEKQHYLIMISSLEGSDDIENLEQFRQRVEEINRSIEDVDYRKANQRAGYVYVISNIGSFGKGVVKIGMTRRLEPMKRIHELSGASVPFNFDLHALFFSADAVGVETRLHRTFADKRINLVNSKREFFAVSPSDVKAALLNISGSLVEFVEEPAAEQYRETVRMRHQ